MHDTTNTCSCDCGVRSRFIVPRFFWKFLVLNLFTFRISGFQFPPGHWSVTDTTTQADGTRRIAVFLSPWWCICFETESTGITGRIRRAHAMWPRRRSYVSSGALRRAYPTPLVLPKRASDGP